MQPPLSNIQVELLKVYAANIPDETLLEMKKVLAKFFLDKARQQTDSIWEENNYSDDFFQTID
ncbi:MAG: hypothetical protein U0X91_30555 [Spirosomataceae bacterium]